VTVSAERLATGMARGARVILACTLLATAVLGAGVRRVRVENPPSKYQLPPDGPVMTQLDRWRALFDESDAVIIAVRFGTPVGPREHEVMAALTDEVGAAAGVRTVRAPLLLSADGRSAAITAEVGYGLSGPAEQRLVSGLTAAAERHRASFVDYHMAGLPIIDVAFGEQLRRDLRVYGVLSAAVALALLLGLYRSVRPVLVGSGLALLSLIWALGIVGLSGTPLSMGLAMMVPLILMMSVAYSAHYLNFWLDRARLEAAVAVPTEAGIHARTRAMIAAVMPPSLLAAVTTAVGFFALNASSVEGIREVGTYVGIGVLATALVNSVVLPALLFAWPTLLPRAGRAPGAAQALAGALARAATRRPAVVVVAAVAVALGAVIGATRIRVDANHLHYLSAETTVRRDYAFVDRSFGGAVPLELLISVPRSSVGHTVERLGALADSLGAVDGIGRVGNPVQAAAAAGLPVHSADAWRAFAGSDAGRRLVHAGAGDSLTFRVSAGAHVRGTHALSRVLDRVEALHARAFPDGGVTVTGMLPVFVHTMDYIVSSQLSSFALAFSIIALVLLALTRSVRIGALAIVANAWPILVGLGLMGWLRIPLDFATAMIASVLIGVVVDDSVHFLHHYRRARSAGSSGAAIADALGTVGSPIVVSTAVFAGGFLVLASSAFAPIRYFGLLSACAVAAALAADLLLLPALIQLTRSGA
jgi:uncharacterized protein